MKQFVIGVCLVIVFIAFESSAKIKVLILSGRNNHDWKTTTPFLENLYSESGLFEVKITEQPDTLTQQDFQDLDVVVSNWSSFPDKTYRWPVETENALLEFIENGGGFVTFHASTTAFYEWPEFKTISTGAWIDGTHHGKQSATEVSIQNKKHPITKGMGDFTIEDELWIDAERNMSFEVLGTATNMELQQKGIENQPAILVNDYGKGRMFHTILGHGVKNMQNADFQALLLRATEWSATGKVKRK
ncbi:ThuA domain-containing protein [Prolixibacteraceae bacterium Z1-6]|uniref:ThuA domain-containing protein n=1 Tax=Draconibacterium aestuarii TaxID=2998507 RepID=A0A9X3F3H0_9BACT|nr:ThuA domain-containing protein [Prolixibacteraceae bacterium Z1-6]